MINCKICDKECKGLQALSNHLGLTHKINTHELKQQYYDTYMKKENEGICQKCGNTTHFQSLNRGYTMYCCKSCQISAQGNGAKIDHDEMWKIRRNKIQQYEIENNCTHIKNLINKYGRVLYYIIDTLQIPIIKESRMYQYISNDYIQQIEHFISVYDRKSGISNEEKYLRSNIQYDKQILFNTKSIIYPYELDIYLPDIKLAIEFNGIYYHSIYHGTSKEYHLNKSLRCREKGIRLIHIYEFENIEEQVYKINQLILGNDLFNLKDFNKNNFRKTIPKPTIIYNDNRLIVYGAGKLY